MLNSETHEMVSGKDSLPAAYHNSLCGPLNVSVTRPIPRVHQIRANVPDPAV